MARKGSNIYKRRDGRYEGRVPVGYRENGSLKYKSVYARTLSEVKEKMSQFYSVRQEQTVSSLIVRQQNSGFVLQNCVLRSQVLQIIRTSSASIFCQH